MHISIRLGFFVSGSTGGHLPKLFARCVFFSTSPFSNSFFPPFSTQLGLTLIFSFLLSASSFFAAVPFFLTTFSLSPFFLFLSLVPPHFYIFSPPHIVAVGFFFRFSPTLRPAIGLFGPLFRPFRILRASLPSPPRPPHLPRIDVAIIPPKLCFGILF